MKCVVCFGQAIQESEVNEQVALGNDIVYVPIRTLVCRTCGERYYDRRTVQYLEKARQQLKSGQGNLREVGKVLVLES